MKWKAKCLHVDSYDTLVSTSIRKKYYQRSTAKPSRMHSCYADKLKLPQWNSTRAQVRFCAFTAIEANMVEKSFTRLASTLTRTHNRRLYKEILDWRVAIGTSVPYFFPCSKVSIVSRKGCQRSGYLTEIIHFVVAVSEGRAQVFLDKISTNREQIYACIRFTILTLRSYLMVALVLMEIELDSWRWFYIFLRSFRFLALPFFSYKHWNVRKSHFGFNKAPSTRSPAILHPALSAYAILTSHHRLSSIETRFLCLVHHIQTIIGESPAHLDAPAPPNIPQLIINSDGTFSVSV